MNTIDFHPIQAFRHLCNRLDSNSCERDSILRDIANDRAEIAAIEQRIKQRQSEAAEVVTKRHKLIAEGRELLPHLRGFRKCFDALNSICLAMTTPTAPALRAATDILSVFPGQAPNDIHVHI